VSVGCTVERMKEEKATTTGKRIKKEENAKAA
jgi:hypothetical protein